MLYVFTKRGGENVVCIYVKKEKEGRKEGRKASPETKVLSVRQKIIS